MDDGHVATTPVTIVTPGPCTVALVRARVAFADMPGAQRRARRILTAALEAAGMRPAGPALTLWRPPVDGLVEYAPGVVVPEAFRGGGEVEVTALPSGRAAHLRLSGSHAGLPEAWDRLVRACAGRASAGVNWEVYAPEGAPEPYADLYALLA